MTKEKAEAEAKAIREKAESDAKAAEEARKAADKEAERLRLAALEQAKTAGTAQIAALPSDAARMSLTPQELSRSLQTELRRVGCQTAAVGIEWNATSRRSLELFNRHAATKLDAKLASLDALDAVKGKQARVCPLICEHGFRASGERCEKIVCRAGYAIGDDNTCEKLEPRKPVAKKDPPQASPNREAQAPKAQSGSGQIICTNHGCRPVARGCRIEQRSGPQAGPSTAGAPIGVEVCN